jgi:hypothetical protein
MKTISIAKRLYRREVFSPGRLLATGCCLTSGLRSLPWWFRSKPGTPLRCLCLAALDFVYRMEFGRPLPRRSYLQLADFLLFAAQQNRILDNKSNEQIRINSKSNFSAYEKELVEIETNRPEKGSDRFNANGIQAYREQVIALALKHSFAIMFCDHDWSRGRSDSSHLYFDWLFRIAMLCQLADDLIDHRRDLAMNLPSFATSLAGHSDPEREILQWIDGYANSSSTSHRSQLWPLRSAAIGMAWPLKQFARHMMRRTLCANS